ncbi:transmembrane amino acid transporter family [Trichoderma arundinaceum]|uniref:Transmembrane amino acid transporter family n=1 Tax=Trichoderma arundinaceum TaxID=490622 RepID=A0A395NIM7_TRIAR|nr:transmembrane amino acid transporter family [Trichoderma arundinaceum]
METTKRTASVSIRNNTSKPMVSISLVHKYSDVYKHRREWAAIPAGDTSSESLKVEYNTGFFTTGRDWWFISWYNQDMKTLHYSNPHNFRGTFDAIEKGVSGDAIVAAGTILAPIALVSGGILALPAAMAAVAAAKATTDKLFDSGDTTGYKQHILRDDDAGKITEIIINEDQTITFKSQSGDSETVYTSTTAPGR